MYVCDNCHFDRSVCVYIRLVSGRSDSAVGYVPDLLLSVCGGQCDFIDAERKKRERKTSGSA